MSSFSQSKPSRTPCARPSPASTSRTRTTSTKRVVISAGVRWSGSSSPHDYFGRGSTFNIRLPRQPAQHALPQRSCRQLLLRRRWRSAELHQELPWQFTPRLGITFDPIGDGKTVFRAGAGLVYDETNFFAATETNAERALCHTDHQHARDGAHQLHESLGRRHGSGQSVPAAVHAARTQTFSPGGQYIVYPTSSRALRPAVDRQLAARVCARLAVPDRLHRQQDHLPPYGFPLDPPSISPATATARSPLLHRPATPASRYARSPCQSRTSGPKYSGGGGGSILISPAATPATTAWSPPSSIASPTPSVFLANYTWSHCIDICRQHRRRRRHHRRRTPTTSRATTRPLRLRLSRHLQHRHRRLQPLRPPGLDRQARQQTGRSRLSSTSSGAPFNVTSGVDNSLTAVSNDRPNLVNPQRRLYRQQDHCSGAVDQRAVHQPLRLSPPIATRNLRQLGRNAFRGPKYLQFDAALSRIFPIRERLHSTSG